MTKPNILFLFPDQWRADWLGSNTDLKLRTPNIDKLQQTGMNFDKCWTPSPLCAPAHACLASGKSYKNCGVVNNDQDYPLEQATYMQKLRDAGYRVAGVGKFDLHKDLKKPLDWYLDGSRSLEEWGFTEGKIDGSSSYRDSGFKASV